MSSDSRPMAATTVLFVCQRHCLQRYRINIPGDRRRTPELVHNVRHDIGMVDEFLKGQILEALIWWTETKKVKQSEI